MDLRHRRYGAAAVAVGLLVGLSAAAPAAAQQKLPEKLTETYVRSAPVATSVTLDADEQAESPTGLRSGPTPTPEGGIAGSEVGASDEYGLDDTKLNERARLAYPE